MRKNLGDLCKSRSTWPLQAANSKLNSILSWSNWLTLKSCLGFHTHEQALSYWTWDLIEDLQRQVYCIDGCFSAESRFKKAEWKQTRGTPSAIGNITCTHARREDPGNSNSYLRKQKQTTTQSFRIHKSMIWLLVNPKENLGWINQARGSRDLERGMYRVNRYKFNTRGNFLATDYIRLACLHWKCVSGTSQWTSVRDAATLILPGSSSSPTVTQVISPKASITLQFPSHTVWPWTSSLTSLSLSFLGCKNK